MEPVNLWQIRMLDALVRTGVHTEELKIAI